MIKHVVITIITGIMAGMILLWIEYIYFIPIFVPTAVIVPKPTPEYSPSTPGEVFHDSLPNGSLGPQMVVIPAGRFSMGDIQVLGANSEQPIHSVFVYRFAMSRNEITFTEYDRFAIVTGREKPADAGWGRGNRPVINLSWSDATAYAKWLSEETGKKYRLPTEAEWEYAARAKTETQYWWGNEIGYNFANCDGCGSRWDNKKTAPVGSFAANPFKLYDTAGNVYEWTCSEYEEKYNGKEQRCLDKDKYEWTCSKYEEKYNSKEQRSLDKDNTTTKLRVVIRGGSWYSSTRFVRAANRYRFSPGYCDNNIGFRVVREIPETEYIPENK